MNWALVKKEFNDIFEEKLYIFAFFAQLAIVLGVLYAALLYTNIAAPESSTFIQSQRPKIGIIGDDPDIYSKLGEDLELIRVKGDPFQLIQQRNLVGVLQIKGPGDFQIYLDNTNLLSGYADTIITDVLGVRSSELQLKDLEEKMETADIIVSPIELNEIKVGERTLQRPPEFIIIMYGLLIPFILLLPTFLSTNMVTDSIVGEKERKTYEVLISAPISKRGIILSKITPILFIALLQSFIWILLIIFRGIPVYNIPLLMVTLLILDVIFIGFGIMLSAFSETLKESNLSVTVILLISSISMFAPLPIKEDISDFNPILLITKLSSNPRVPIEDLIPIIPLLVMALLILYMGELMLKKHETLRL